MSVIPYIDLAQMVLDAGFPAGEKARDTIAIVACESGRDPAFRKQIVDPGNPADGSYDRGLCAINSYWHPEVSDNCAFDAECALGAMYAIAHGGTDFKPFGCFTSGQYKNHLEAATVSLDGAKRVRDFKATLAARDATIIAQNQQIAYLQTQLAASSATIEQLSGQVAKLQSDLADEVALADQLQGKITKAQADLA